MKLRLGAFLLPSVGATPDEFERGRAGRIAGAVLLDNQSVQDFIEDTDKSVPVLVYCYHGNSSQSAAAWLADKGFAEVYSLDGGFEYWKGQYPVEP